MENKLKLNYAIVVEGRDDVDAVGKACDALLIPTHGFGITRETWSVIEKAYNEKGIIILTDPDFSGEEIRKKLTARFPDAIQAYVPKDDATLADDIGIENATPEVIKLALEKAIAREGKAADEGADFQAVTMNDLVELGLTGCDGAGPLRAAVCDRLGIGYGNGKAMLKKLEHWKIGRETIEEAIKKIQEK